MIIMIIYYYISIIILSLLLSCESDEKRLPIVYAFTVVPAVCPLGLPTYIQVSLQQAVLSQPDSDVILASNFGECEHIKKVVSGIHGVILVDISGIESERTKEFKNLSLNMFSTDGGAELWLTSASRFFHLEDIMIKNNYTEMIHVEADNLLYGRLSSLLQTFRSGYPTLAATPLNANKSFITASVMWIASVDAIKMLCNYFLDLGRNFEGAWDRYLKWMRHYGCCKHGGVAADEHGNGLKPFSINEMSMLAYFHELYPKNFTLLPVVPKYDYYINRYVINMSLFGPGGHEVGPMTGNGIWDPNSWGQFLGGTHSKKARDRKFTDPSHIAGQAMRLNPCRPSMECANRSLSSTFSRIPNTTDECVTAPFVRCGNPGQETEWTLLWNLHVHSKLTDEWRSRPCACKD